MTNALDAHLKAQDIWEKLDSFDRIKILEQIRFIYLNHDQCRAITNNDNLNTIRGSLCKNGGVGTKIADLALDVLVLSLIHI